MDRFGSQDPVATSSGVIGQTVDAQTAIMLVNQRQMEAHAWRKVFAADSFPIEDQVAISIVAAQNYSHNGTGKTMQLLKALSLSLNKSEDAAALRLRKMENNYIVQRQNDNQGNVWHWELKNAAIRTALDELAKIKIAIMKVVALQYEHPDDPEIGKDLLPEGVYFNIVANRKAWEHNSYLVQ